MGVFDSINVSASALTAQKTRIDVITKNIANAETTQAAGGMPYRRQMAVFKEIRNTPFSEYLSKFSDEKAENSDGGVKISKIVEDTTPFKLVYDPGNPEADEDGYVKMPNVEVINEMVDMIDAQRAYVANITAMNSTKTMLMKALEIGKE